MRTLEELYIKPEIEKLSYSSRLEALLREFAQRAQLEGMPVKTFSESRPLHTVFAQAPLLRQQKTYENFKQFYDVCADAIRNEIPLVQGSRLLWRMISKLGLTPCSDLFDKIEEEDVLEIYDCELMQVFRNFKFLELCNYSLDQVLSYQLTELFQRPHAITMTMLDQVQKLLSNDGKGSTVVADIPLHTLEEVMTPEKAQFLIEHRYFSPLYNDDKTIVGFVSTLKARPL